MLDIRKHTEEILPAIIAQGIANRLNKLMPINFSTALHNFKALLKILFIRTIPLIPTKRVPEFTNETIFLKA